jgi:hypothetical protein
MYDACGWGEGLVQVTWCANKRKVFSNLGLPTYQGINDKRLQQPDIAAKALCSGMDGGWYTGVSLGNCISGSSVNLACARSIVNGDYGRVGAQINQSYAQFDKALSSAGSTTASNDKSNDSTGVICTPTDSSAGSPGSGSANPQKIMASVNKLRGMSSASGPSGGNEACAWTVNQVLKDAGYAPLGTGGPTRNPNWVPDIDYDLSHGRGTLVSPSQAQPGDIILSKGDEHIGFCINVGCTQVLSNSSSLKSFSWQSNGNFGGFYDNSKYLSEQPTNRIYRLNQ